MTASEQPGRPAAEPDEQVGHDDAVAGDDRPAGSGSVQVEDDGSGPAAADRGRGVPEPAD